MADPRLQALPYDEAISALGRRADNPLSSEAWHSVAAETHADAFTVARSAGFDILGDIADSLRANLAGGGTFAGWKKDITPVLKAKGWWGLTEDGVQLGSPRRLRTIYDVNLRVSHAAGAWSRIERQKDRRPYLRYVSVQDRRTRPAHRGWHGTVLPVDDPWWSTHAPPNGWRCRCSVQQLSEREANRYGYEVGNPPPDVGTRLWTNPSTGEVLRVPHGIDPGWAHNPGRQQTLGMATLAKLAPKPAALGAAAAEAIPGLTGRVAREYRDWLARIDPARPAGEVRPVGLLSPKVVEGLALAGREPATASILVRDQDVAHMLRDAKGARGLGRDEIERLPDVLAKPESVLLDGDTDGLIYVFSTTGTGGKGKFVVKVDYTIKTRDDTTDRRTSAKTNVVRTAAHEDAASLRDHTRYRLLEGEWP